MSDVTYLGTTDDVTVCECCGKKDLKSTVAISVDGGDAMFFGVVCAARALRRSAKEVRSESRKADEARAAAARTAKAAADRAATAVWFAFLAQHGKGSEVIHQIESLGGWTAARAAFKAQQAAGAVAS
jgi:hypothetical protein